MSHRDPTARPPLVLIVNDQEWALRSLESILGPNGYAVLRAYTGRQAFEFARSAHPDAVIVDVRLPDLDGAEVCRTLRADPRFGAHTPLLVTASGPVDRAQVLAAYDAGAWELAVQPIDGDLLLRKLATYVGAKRTVDRVTEEGLLDQISGVYSMRGLARRAREIGAEAVRQHHPLACVAVSTEADAGGDDPFLDRLAARVAEHLGELLRRTGRASDAVGRLGQAEFGIVAPGTEATGAIRIVERLEQALAADPLTVDGERRDLKLRAGYYAVQDLAEAPLDVIEMLLRAAEALRAARSEGAGRGGRIRAFGDAPRSVQ